jgi:hypothetical protein
MVHWQVPQPPVRLECDRVPPSLVKEPVSEPQDLSQQVHPNVEEDVEAGEPDVPAQGKSADLMPSEAMKRGRHVRAQRPGGL